MKQLTLTDFDKQKIQSLIDAFGLVDVYITKGERTRRSVSIDKSKLRSNNSLQRDVNDLYKKYYNNNIGCTSCLSKFVTRLVELKKLLELPQNNQNNGDGEQG